MRCMSDENLITPRVIFDCHIYASLKNPIFCEILQNKYEDSENRKNV